MVGSFDLGVRYALYAKWTSGFWKGHYTGNHDVWRHWVPLFAGAIFTSFLAPPFEAAEKAYIGDLTFPKELRHGYTSRFNALYRLALENPFALYRNSLPTMASSFIQTTFSIGIHDFLSMLFEPIWSHGGSDPDAVKFVYANLDRSGFHQQWPACFRSHWQSPPGPLSNSDQNR